MSDYIQNLELLKFKKDPVMDVWRAVFEGVDLKACLHPDKGLAISFSCVEKRVASEGEIFLPKSSSISEIAQAIMTIHQQCNK